MPHPYLNTAIEIVRKAGYHIVKSRDKPSRITVTEKTPHNFVTNVDTESEEIIISKLHEAYPKHNFMAEERGEVRFSDEDITWIIDPLDGTTNFIHNFPYYCISLAVRQADLIQHAIVYNPVTHEMFTASRGEGARYNDRPMRVSAQRYLDNALLAIGTPKRPERLAQHFDIMHKLHSEHHIGGMRKIGSTALHLAYVAAGLIDAFTHSDQKIWDLAAGSLLVEESGGLITDYNGREDYFDNGECLVANPKLLSQLAPLFTS